MSYRDALKVFKLERELSDDETAFLSTLRQMGEMSDSDRELIAETLAPTPVKPAKKPTTERNIEHCVACNYTRRAIHHKDAAHKDYHEFQSSSAQKKSKHAASISEAIQGTAGAAGKVAAANDDESDSNKPGIVGGCSHCGEPADYPIHDLNGGYMTYHPFVEPSLAHPATGKPSSKNGEGASSTASSEIVRGDVGSVVHEQNSNAGA